MRYLFLEGGVVRVCKSTRLVPNFLAPVHEPIHQIHPLNRLHSVTPYRSCSVLPSRDASLHGPLFSHRINVAYHTSLRGPFIKVVVCVARQITRKSGRKWKEKKKKNSKGRGVCNCFCPCRGVEGIMSYRESGARCCLIEREGGKGCG